MRTGWPVRLEFEGVVLRPLRRRDASTWLRLRDENWLWLSRWDATAPYLKPLSRSMSSTVASMLRAARRQEMLPFVIEIDGDFVGQVNVANVTRGSAQCASIGYWIAKEYAGRGITTRALALAIDHCFFVAQLHRLEISIRPENTASLRVVEKLNIPYLGYAPRYLHIDGDWRDHRVFSITREDAPAGVLGRLKSHQPHK